MSAPGSFFLNDDTHILVARMYAERQRRHAAAISSGITMPLGPLCLHAQELVTSPPAVAVAALSVVEAPDQCEIVISVVDPQPPRYAELMLIACAKSPADAEGLIGDLYERFRRDCAKRGLARAKLIYWAYTVQSLWPLLKRAMARAATWAAIISAIKRFFVG
jgi:hypothetical protein